MKKYIKVKKGIFSKASFKINMEKGLVLCPICGVLKVEHGDIIHPAMDKELVDLLDNGFKVTYTK
jgi:hypothetical protein